jgi:hypothetical protein
MDVVPEKEVVEDRVVVAGQVPNVECRLLTVM